MFVGMGHLSEGSYNFGLAVLDHFHFFSFPEYPYLLSHSLDISYASLSPVPQCSEEVRSMLNSQILWWICFTLWREIRSYETARRMDPELLSKILDLVHQW